MVFGYLVEREAIFLIEQLLGDKQEDIEKVK